MSASIICKNCNHHFKGNFCPHCGQSAKVEAIGVKYFLHDIPHSVLHIDKGFFYTLKKLFTAPGKTLKEYLEGKRVKHFRPFAFVIIMSAVCSLLISGIEKIINSNLAQKGVAYRIDTGHTFFGKYPSLLVFALIPVLSLITWLFFKKRIYSYWEHALLNTYIAALVNIFFLLLKLYQLIKLLLTGNVNASYFVFMTMFMTYYGFAFSALMRENSNRLLLTARLFLMTLFLSLTYMTAFSLSGIMTPWWGK